MSTDTDTGSADMAPVETARLLLLSLRGRDLPAFTAYRQDPLVARYQGWGSEYSMDKARELLAKQAAGPFGEPGSWHQISILDKATRHMLGDCVIHFCETDDESGGDKQAEIGFTLATQHQGQGFAIEAVSALIKLAFEVLQIRRVTATVDVLNEKSMTLLEKLKFRREAHYVENIWFNECWGSEYLYALLQREYINS
jgi:RimJ/RimL family protein N-acetyltransferase